MKAFSDYAITMSWCDPATGESISLRVYDGDWRKLARMSRWHRWVHHRKMRFTIQRIARQFRRGSR